MAVAWGDCAMKLVTEYLENAVHFECLAAETKGQNLKAELEKQAIAYYQLAAKRAEEIGGTPAKEAQGTQKDREQRG